MGGINPAGLQMAYGALAQAYEDSSPLLCLADGIPAAAGGVQRFDIAAAFASVTKWIGRIETPEQVPAVMRRAFSALRNGRPGPVLVTVPQGLGTYDPAQQPYTPVPRWRSAPDPADVAAAVAALRPPGAPHLRGEGVLYAGGADALLRWPRPAASRCSPPSRARAPSRKIIPWRWGCAASRPWRRLRGCDASWRWAPACPRPLPPHHPDAANKVIVHAPSTPPT
jgi:hypothetical protein